MPSGAPCCAPILQSVYIVLGKRCVECLGCVLLVLRKKVEAPSFSGIGDAASWSFGIEVEGLWGDEAATFLTLLAHTKARQTPALLHHSLTNALIYGSSASSRMRPCMSSHLPSLTKTSQAATTLRATPLLPSVRSSLKFPTSATTAESRPLRKETGLDLALSHARRYVNGYHRAQCLEVDS